MTTRNNPHTTVFQGRFLQVNQRRNQGMVVGLFATVPVDVFRSWRAHHDVVVLIREQFDVWTQDPFQCLQNYGMRASFLDMRSPAKGLLTVF